MLMKTASTLAKAGNGIIGTDEEAFTNVTDAMALLLRTSQDTSVDRRTKILNGHSIHKKYVQVASRDVPITGSALWE